MSKQKLRIAIVGAGPAGIYTSLLLEGCGCEAHLFEQNEHVGEKLKMTGGGRMNISNKIFSVDQFSSENMNCLKKLFKSPWVSGRMKIFEDLGVEYMWDGDRAMLKSENAIAEVQRLEEELLGQKNLICHFGERVDDLSKLEKDFDAVVLCGGGMFRVKDDGDVAEMYKLALDAGHKIGEVRPALGAIGVNEHLLAAYSGIPFVGTFTDSANKKSVSGDILITHHGFSGPAALDFSALSSGEDAFISFISGKSEEDFHNDIAEMRNGKHRIRQYLHKLLPGRLMDWHLEKADIALEAIVADLNKEKIKSLCANLFHYRVSISLPSDFRKTWTTNGGVSLEEVTLSTLESRLHKNLYFAGEILDVNGLCGGYNISFAAISAKIVSEAICKNL